MPDDPPPFRAAPEFAGLMRAVRDRPDDDLPRLVLADWLEEQGAGPWAELILAQCAAAPATAAREVGLERRAKRFLAELRPPARGLRTLPRGAWRGLPGVGVHSVWGFLRAADRLNDPAPAESLALKDWVGMQATFALAAAPAAARLRALKLGVAGENGNAVRALAVGPHLRGLRRMSLTLTDAPLPDVVAGLDQPSAWPHLTRLKLTLYEYPAGIPADSWAEGAEALAAARHLPALREVELPRADRFPEAARDALAARFERVEYGRY